MCFTTLSFTVVPTHRLASKIIKEEGGGGVRPDDRGTEAREHFQEAEREKNHSNIVLGPRRLNGDCTGTVRELHGHFTGTVQLARGSATQVTQDTYRRHSIENVRRSHAIRGVGVTA